MTEMLRNNEAGKVSAEQVMAAALVVTVGAFSLRACASETEDTSRFDQQPSEQLACDSSDEDKPSIDNHSHGGVLHPWDGEVLVLSYDLQPGEFLQQVSSCFYDDIDKGILTLSEDNNITDRNVVQPGKIDVVIRNPARVILSESVPTVQELAAETGFTLDQIAAANGKNWADDSSWSPSINDEIRLPRHSEIQEPVVITGISTEQPSEQPHGQNPERGEVAKAFLQQYGELAQEVEDIYGIPKNAVLAQAALESGFGTSALAQRNAYFGIKAWSSDEPGEFWDGAVYRKITDEHLTDEQIASNEFPGWVATGSRNAETGKTPGNVEQIFRIYDSIRDSFFDYAERISKRSVYANAYDARGDALEYIELVAAAGYGTDSDYEEKVTNLYLLFQEFDPEQPDPERPGGEVPKTIDERIESVELSPRGYEDFVNSINRDYIEFASTKKAYQGGGLVQDKSVDKGIWHFTTLYYNGIGSGHGTATPVGDKTDVEHFITSTDNVDGRRSDGIPGHKDNCCGVQWLIGRDGEVYQLLPDDDITRRLMHNPPTNETTIGVEIEAGTQAEVLPVQYEAAAYLAAYWIKSGQINNPDRALDQLIRGHGEDRAEARSSNRRLQVREDFPERESVLLRQKLQALLAEL